MLFYNILLILFNIILYVTNPYENYLYYKYKAYKIIFY